MLHDLPIIIISRMSYDSKTDRYYDEEGVTITPVGFGQTSAVEYIAVNDLFQLTIHDELVDYFVHRGYQRGKSIRGASYDWRHAAGMCMSILL